MLFLWSPVSLNGQSESNLVVLESAELVISGKTNINDFTCRLIKSHINKTLTYETDITNGVDLFKGLELNFDVSDFECDKSLMTSDLKKLLKEDEYPFITMYINDVIEERDLKQNDIWPISAYITIHIAGHAEQEYIQDAYLKQTDQWVALSGKHRVLMTTFKIDPPTKLFGAVQTEDSIEILFSIKLR